MDRKQPPTKIRENARKCKENRDDRFIRLKWAYITQNGKIVILGDWTGTIAATSAEKVLRHRCDGHGDKWRDSDAIDTISSYRLTFWPFAQIFTGFHHFTVKWGATVTVTIHGTGVLMSVVEPEPAGKG